MRGKILLCFLLAFAGIRPAAQAQLTDSVWTLQACIAYAQEHNISIRQNVLNERLAALRLQQNRYAQLPSVNLGGTFGQSFGRSVNPTTNQFENGSYRFLSLNANADVLLFGWFSKRYATEASELNAKAARYDVTQNSDDVALNIATGYLRALLAKQQIGIQQEQLALTGAQLSQTRTFVKAGRLPELNAAQLASQQATDSAAYINAISEYELALLDLKAMLNLDFKTPFGVAAPQLPETLLHEGDLPDPEALYEQAGSRFGAIQAAALRIQSAEKTAQSASAARYPQLSLTGQLGNNWSSNYQTVSGFTPNGYAPSAQYFTQTLTGADTLFTPIYSLSGSPEFSTVPFRTQFSNNFRQLVGINLNVPLFNGWQAQYNYRQAQVNIESQKLQLDQSRLVLKQNIYKAWTAAKNARTKYSAAVRALESATQALSYAEKRYAIGLTNTVEYLVTQNARYGAATAMQTALYDYIFRLKVLDYYQGKTLQL